VWARRQERLDFRPQVCFCNPDLSTLGRWRRFFDQLIRLGMERPFDLLVIDSLTSFLPAAESDPRSLRRALEELRFGEWFACGVLLVHHPRRAGGVPGSAARGSGALTALTDIVLDLRRPRGDPLSRRRQLYRVGRYADGPQQLLLELNAAGTDYAVLANSDADPAAFAPALERLRELLGRAPGPLTRQQILACWGNDLTRPAPLTLWRWLTRGCEAGVLVHHGDGSKGHPLRYTLASAAAAGAPAVPADDSGEPLPDPGPGAAVDLAAPAAVPPSAGPELPPPVPGPAAVSLASLAPAHAPETQMATPVTPRPVPPNEAAPPGGSAEDTAEATPPAQAPAPAEPATAAGPVSDSVQEQSAAAPPPPAGSATLPELPPHARWLLGLLAPAPEQYHQPGENR
jgi:hypothetical protein